MLSGPSGRCPLWVISGHFAVQSLCPLYPQWRTFVGAVEMPVCAIEREPNGLITLT